MTGGKRNTSAPSGRLRVISAVRPPMTSSKTPVRPCTPFAAVGWRMLEVMASRRSVDTWLGISVSQARRHVEEQQRTGCAREDAFVVDHDRRGQHVAELTRDAELTVVSVSR